MYVDRKLVTTGKLLVTICSIRWGTVHGGWAMTLSDSATGCAGYSLMPARAGFRTVETKVNLSRPITSDTGRVRTKAHVVSQTRQIISTEARLTSREGRVLGHCTSTLMVVPGST
jgi:uncharacterized protein (TIGR00369 family)